MQEILDKLSARFKFNVKQYESIKCVLDACREFGLFDKRQIAYILATIKHETANTWLPIKEFGGVKYFIKRYWLNSRVARWLGNDDANDAAKYFGRGYVQLTGETNYENFSKILGVDLTKNPDLVLDPKISAKIAIYGMMRGSFSGKKLTDYFTPTVSNAVGARRIINGIDRAEDIAKIYSEILNII